MRKTLYIILLNCLLFPNNNEYLWPTDNKDVITTTFCEPRHRRFHAGIDIRTYGNIGDNLYAIDSGKVVRLKVEPNKYGKALYIQLDDGNIVLYSHLDEFNASIKELSHKLKSQYNSSFYDHHLLENEIIVIKRGEIIGYTGDTGSLSGPHLHFEIRDKQNNPINPLIKYYNIYDNINPYANRICFIPLDKKSWINGIQDYQLFNLKKINDYKYIVEDTISVTGNFGIAIETFDKINNLPFKFGVHQIEMYIDDILKYSILFDKYNFKEDHLIYSEIDFNLLKTNGVFHRLFNRNENFPFIKKNTKKLNIDSNFHNFIINISDANSNSIQIQGVLSGSAIATPEFNYHLNENSDFIIEGDREQFRNSKFNLISKYDNITNAIAIDSSLILKEKISDIYNILEYSYNNNNLNARKGYLTLQNSNPYEIKGEFKFKFIEDNLIIEFHEEILTGLNPELLLDDSTSIKLYRKDKFILSTGFIDINKIKNVSNISILYDTNPEIIFQKDLNILSEKNNFTFKNIHLNTIDTNQTIFLIEEAKKKISKNFTIIENSFTIGPNNISYLEPIEIIIDNKTNCKNCGIYKYDDDDGTWIYKNTELLDDKIKTFIFSSGTFAVLHENEAPHVSKMVPALNATYKYEDIKNINFIVEDRLSGIDAYSINIILNKKKLFYDYIPYRNLVRADILNFLELGKNNISISLIDNLGNNKNIYGEFTIIE